MIERLIQIRGELGFTEAIYMDRSQEITDFLDAYGFDIYAFSTDNEKINFDNYTGGRSGRRQSALFDDRSLIEQSLQIN